MQVSVIFTDIVLHLLLLLLLVLLLFEKVKVSHHSTNELESFM